MSTELLPCPFCGATASGYAIEPHVHTLSIGGFRMPDHPGSYVVEGDCACGSGMIGDTQAEVTERWNRRATPTPPVEPVKEADVSAIRDAALEAAAKEFDRRDRGAGGFYDPHEPAEIIRALRGGTP